MNNIVMNSLRNKINNRSSYNKTLHIRTNNLTNSNFLTNETTDLSIPANNYKIDEKNFNFQKVNDNQHSRINNLKVNNKYSNNIFYHSKINSTPIENIQTKYKYNNKLIKTKGFDNNFYKGQYLTNNNNYYNYY